MKLDKHTNIQLLGYVGRPEDEEYEAAKVKLFKFIRDNGPGWQRALTIAENREEFLDLRKIPWSVLEAWADEWDSARFEGERGLSPKEMLISSAVLEEHPCNTAQSLNEDMVLCWREMARLQHNILRLDLMLTAEAEDTARQSKRVDEAAAAKEHLKLHQAADAAKEHPYQYAAAALTVEKKEQDKVHDGKTNAPTELRLSELFDSLRDATDDLQRYFPFALLDSPVGKAIRRLKEARDMVFIAWQEVKQANNE